MSQDIEIDPDSRTITYYEKPTVNPDLEDIKSRALYQQGGPNPVQVLIHESDFNYLLVEIDRLRKLVPPETERGPGFVGQGSWSVFAEKVVEERDEARDELTVLANENGVLRADVERLERELEHAEDEIGKLGAMIAAKKEHTSTHFNDKDNFVGIDGYGQFSLKQVDKDRWEIHMLNEKVTLYNKKGHRVRGDHNYDGDW